jgi:hypothetical protein
MWVSDVNGPLEAGDLITSSQIPGYGMKQDDDNFAPYTVAKITMECDFTAPLQPQMQLRKDPYGNTIKDANGSPIWDTTENYEPAYKLRYINHSGNIITKEEYETSSSNVYKAAFVGVTYHCG